MKKERFKVEIVDDDGARVTLTLDGKEFDRSLAKFVSMVETLRKSQISGGTKIGEEVEKQEIAEGTVEPIANPALTSASLSKRRASELLAPMSVRVQDRSRINEVLVLVRSLPDDWFTSLDLRGFYEQRFGTTMSLSMISTYLSRLVDKGYLYRVKGGRAFKYRIKRDTVKPQL